MSLNNGVIVSNVFFATISLFLYNMLNITLMDVESPIISPNALSLFQISHISMI